MSSLPWVLSIVSIPLGGFMNMGSNLGGLISPTLTPIIASYIGWEKALQVAAGLAVIGSVLWLGIKPAVRE